MDTVVRFRERITDVTGLEDVKEPATFYYIMHSAPDGPRWKRIIHCVRCDVNAPAEGKAELNRYCSRISPGLILGGGIVHVGHTCVAIAGFHERYGREPDRSVTTLRAFAMQFPGKQIHLTA